jgi:hypothetical protein
MEWGRAQRLSAAGPAWRRLELQARLARVLAELRALRLQASAESKFQRAEKAWWEWLWFLIEPSPTM